MASSVDLGKQLEGFVARLVKSGRYNSRSEILREGVRLIHERETRLAALDASISRGVADAEAGRVEDADIVAQELDALRAQALDERLDPLHLEPEPCDAPAGRVAGAVDLVAGRRKDLHQLDHLAAPAHEREAQLHADSTADLMFTSGTTGRPKGVMAGHEPTIRAFTEWARVVGLGEGDRYLIINPFFHTFGYKAGWVAAFLCGATVFPHQVFDADAVLERIQSDRISFLPGPPTLFLSMLAHPRLAGFDLSSLRSAVTGAASVPPVLITRMREELGIRNVTTAYGLTECGGCATVCDPSDSAETIANTCGKALPGTEMRCVDAQGRSVPPGEPGEVVLRGYHVMQGYFEDEAATREAIDEQGWLHTGDVGVVDERGYLRITDRLKDMYISGGFNCYPAEIERLMAPHPAVAQVAVIGVADERLGEIGCAFVVRRPGAELSEADCIAWCRRQMANYKVPRHVRFVDALPTNASNKVDKKSLRADWACGKN